MHALSRPTFSLNRRGTGRLAVENSFPKLLATTPVNKNRPTNQRMCDVLPLQPAGAFLRQAQKLQPSFFADPIALVGSCNDIDVALQLRPECDGEDAMTHHSVAYQMGQSQLNEPVDFLTTIRHGLDELVADDESDDESDEEGEYYQASKENMYYSPEQKDSCGFLLDDGLYLSDTSTASSSLFTAWAQQESDDDDDTDDDTNELIFQLEL